jgi:hypothetical protein
MFMVYHIVSVATPDDPRIIRTCHCCAVDSYFIHYLRFILLLASSIGSSASFSVGVFLKDQPFRRYSRLQLSNYFFFAGSISSARRTVA